MQPATILSASDYFVRQRLNVRVRQQKSNILKGGQPPFGSIWVTTGSFVDDELRSY
jgi:hypothetical protein